MAGTLEFNMAISARLSAHISGRKAAPKRSAPAGDLQGWKPCGAAAPKAQPDHPAPGSGSDGRAATGLGVIQPPQTDGTAHRSDQTAG
ncbi:hypothetical protein [uncultured Ruegeria sp.]|uniref:hypothetical protein n=1 Tax=uncultured Ruegeria sp. TaxID=259304 RepID=UPI0026239C15|nr:hypothetical protein [uncultured Ruegeria sp.]